MVEGMWVMARHLFVSLSVGSGVWEGRDWQESASEREHGGNKEVSSHKGGRLEEGTPLCLCGLALRGDLHVAVVWLPGGGTGPTRTSNRA